MIILIIWIEFQSNITKYFLCFFMRIYVCINIKRNPIQLSKKNYRIETVNFFSKTKIFRDFWSFFYFLQHVLKQFRKGKKLGNRMPITIHNIPQKNGIVLKVHLKFNVILGNFSKLSIFRVASSRVRFKYAWKKINKIIFWNLLQ